MIDTTSRALALTASLLVAGACAQERDPSAAETPDGGSPIGVVEGGVADAGAIDAGTIDGGAAQAVCPIDAPRRDLVATSLNGYVVEAGLVATHARRLEGAFMGSLPGTVQLFQNFAFLVEECTAPRIFDPWCQGGGISPGGGGVPGGGGGEDFFATRDLCTRLACEDDGIFLYEVWLTMMPNTSPDVPHPFEFPTTNPAGRGHSYPNPHWTWRADLRDGDNAAVSKDMTLDLTIELPGGALIDGDHRAQLSATRTATSEHEDIAIEVTASFPRLAGDEATGIDARVTIAATGTIAGEIRQGPTLIGSLSGSYDLERGLAFEWVELCR